MTKRLLAIVMAAVSSFLPMTSERAWAFGSNDAGTSGATFLKIGPGARPAGMGQAFTGVADDIQSIYYNPAGLAGLKLPEMTGMHMQYFQSIQYEFAAFAYPTEDAGTWGLAVSNLHTDDIDRRTDDTDTPIDQFSSEDYAYWLSYAYPLTSRLSLGVNAKYIRQVLDSTSADAFAADGGLLYDTGWKDVRLGANVQNVGNRIKFVDESDPLPFTMRFGASAPLWYDHLRLSTDLIVPRDQSVGIAVGGEYRRTFAPGYSWAIRSGYLSGSDADGLTGVSAGGGVSIGRFGFDFAWVPFGDLGNSYRYSLHVLFGDPDSGAEHPVLRSAKP